MLPVVRELNVVKDFSWEFFDRTCGERGGFSVRFGGFSNENVASRRLTSPAYRHFIEVRDSALSGILGIG